MSQALIRNLRDCSEFRLTLQARPPRLVHRTAFVLAALLGAGACWLALTRANLVVRAPGRVRPVTPPKKVFNPVRGEVLGSSLGGQVGEVHAREGDEVRQGDVLIRLDTERLDIELAKKKRNLRSAEEELTRLTRMEELLTQQYEASKAKTEAEMAQVVQEVQREKDGKSADIQLARVDLQLAQDQVDRNQMVMSKTHAVAPADMVKALGRLHAAKEQLAKAAVPVNEGQVEVLRQALFLAEKDYHVKRSELAIKRGLKEGEIDAARFDVANLELERKQAVLHAPIDGVVTSGDWKAGDVLEPGKPVFEIAAQKGFRFEVLVPSDDVGKLRVGLPVRLKLDPFDYQKYGTVTGTVCYISPDSTTAKEYRVPVYTVKVEVAADEVGRGEQRGRIKLGMTGQAEIITGQQSLFTALVRTVRQSISLD